VKKKMKKNFKDSVEQLIATDRHSDSRRQKKIRASRQVEAVVRYRRERLRRERIAKHGSKP
jgi:hypothetical protein